MHKLRRVCQILFFAYVILYVINIPATALVVPWALEGNVTAIVWHYIILLSFPVIIALDLAVFGLRTGTRVVLWLFPSLSGGANAKTR